MSSTKARWGPCPGNREHCLKLVPRLLRTHEGWPKAIRTDQGWSQRPLAHPHRRSLADQPRPRSHPRRGRAPPALHRAHPLLPRRGRRGRQGHARHAAAAPVHQSASSSRSRRRKQSADEHERMLGCAEEVLQAPRPAVSRHDAVHRRHGLRARPRPTTSRSGCRGRGPIARSRPARSAPISRRGA